VTSQGSDLHLSGSQWVPDDVFADATDDKLVDVERYLTSKGWTSFLTIGVPEGGSLYMQTWQRHGEGHPEYLLEVGNADVGSPYMRVDDLPTLLDLVARWAPAVQVACIADVVRDLKEPVIEHEGMVESVAARAAWGVQDRLPTLREYRQQWDADVNARRREARTPPEPGQ
jgi:hypothetical protein